MRSPVKIKSGAFWLAYFVVSILVIGGVLAYGVAAPIYLLARIFPALWEPADWVLFKGISLLMAVQPWYRGHRELDPSLSQPSEQGVLIVSNHRSHLDAFLLLAYVRGVRILARHSLFLIPGLAGMMRLSGQISAGDPVLNPIAHRIAERLARGQRVHVFPELTRCPRRFVGTRKFSLAPFQAAFRTGARVLPLAITGTDAVWGKGAFGISPGHPVRLRTLEWLDPRDFASAEALRERARELIDEALIPHELRPATLLAASLASGPALAPASAAAGAVAPPVSP